MVMEVRALDSEVCTGGFEKGWPKPTNQIEADKKLENHTNTRKKYHIFLKQMSASTREFDVMMKLEYEKEVEVDGE